MFMRLIVGVSACLFPPMYGDAWMQPPRLQVKPQFLKTEYSGYIYPQRASQQETSDDGDFSDDTTISEVDFDFEEATIEANTGGSITKSTDKGKGTLPRKRKRAKRPIVAVIGRPNVGKSMLSNRISGANNRGAIVHDEPGVTRDRTYLRAEFNGYNFDLVDTGGLVFDDDDSLFLGEIRQQAAIALSEASAAILVVDGQSGLTGMDDAVATFLRKEYLSEMPVLVAVNKCESQTVGLTQAADFWSLGLGEPYPVSGIHGTGLAEMLEVLTDELAKNAPTDDDEEALTQEEEESDWVNIALVGRPNVGKSSLFNRLFGENRAMVSDVAGTTRDTLDAEVERNGTVYRLLDTAGIRRKGRVRYGSEFFMVNRALKAIKRADVVLLVLDATVGISDQDRTLADRIAQDGRACVVLLNKWDAVADKDDRTYLKAVDHIREMLPPVRWAPILLVSALSGQRCPKIYDFVDAAFANHKKQISTSVLNDVLREAVTWQPPPNTKGSQGKIYYCSQIDAAPPTLAVFCNKASLFNDNYKRYLDRKLREGLGMEGTPIKLVWRGKKVRTLEQRARKIKDSSASQNY